MKKFLALVLCLPLLGIAPTSAVEVAAGMQDVSNFEVASQGKNYVATWTTYSPDNDSFVLYASVKRGSGAWSSASIITSGTGYISPDVAVLQNGKIFVAAVVDQQFLVSTTSNTGKTFSDFSVAKGAGTFTFQNPSDFGLHASGNTLTAYGAVTKNNRPEIYVFDLTVNSKTWKPKFVMDAFPSSQFTPCELDGDNCYLNIRFDLSSNSKGQQTMAVIVNHNLRNGENYDETYVLFETQRKSLKSNWTSPDILERYGPATIQSYYFWVTGNVTTAKGKSALAWTSGFNSETARARISVSKSFGKEFKPSDNSELSKDEGSYDAQLLATGETIQAVYVRRTANQDGSIYIGKVGNLKNAVQAEFDGYWLIALYKINSVLKVIYFLPDPETNVTNSYAMNFKNGKWATPKVIFPEPNDPLKLWAWNTDFATNGTNIIGAVSAFNESEQIYGIGLDIHIFK